MAFKKLAALAALLFVFATTTQADSITLTVKSWAYSTSGATDSTSLTVVATDSSGKEISLAVNFPDFTFVGFPSNTYATSATGLVSLSSLSAVAVIPRGTINSVFSLGASQALPPAASGTTNVSIGFTGSLKVYAGEIFSPSDPKQTLSTTLSLTVTPGIGTYTIGPTGTRTLTLTGTSGTITIDQGLVAVPEPTTLLLFGTGVAVIGLRIRRRR